MGSIMSRLNLDAVLRSIVPHVYFQPPPTQSIDYPCVIYTTDDAPIRHADNILYGVTFKYALVLIDKNPDTEYIKPLLELPYCTFRKGFIANNLNHFQMYIYTP